MKYLKTILCAMMLVHFGVTAQTISSEEFPTWKWVLDAKFDMASQFHEGFAAIKTQGKWGFIDKSGDTVIKPQFESVKNFSDSMAAVRQNGKWGYINNKGLVVVPPQYYDAYNFTDDIARVERYVNDKEYYINRNGKFTPIVPEKKKSKIKTPTHRIAFPSVEKGKYGYVDKKKNWVIYPKFTNAKDFSDSVACVNIDGKWGYITLATPYECVNMYIQNEIKKAKHTDIAAELVTLFNKTMDNFKNSPLYTSDKSFAEVGDYDTINKTVMIKMPTFGVLITPVEEQDALSLKTNFTQVEFTDPAFTIVKNSCTQQPEIILTNINIKNKANNKVYKWNYKDNHAHKDYEYTCQYEYISMREAFGAGLSIDLIKEGSETNNDKSE